MSDNKTTWEFQINDKLSAILDKLDQKFSKLQVTTEKTEGILKRVFTGAVGFAFALNNVFGAAQAAEQILDKTVGTSLRLANQFEQTKISFETFTGDTEVGDKLLGDLKHLADTTVLQNNATYDAGRTLLGFGVSADKILPTIHELGDISGGNTEKLQSLTLAFAQMSSAGRLMGQDLLQFVNAGFNPLHEISVMTGVSMADLKKKMEDGAISSDMVAAAFEHATSQGGLFFEMMDKQSETSAGRLSVLQSNWQNFLMAVGQDMQPFENQLIDVGNALINGLGAGFKWLEENGATIREVLTYVSVALATVLANVIALNAAVILSNIQFGIWAIRYYAVTIAQWALNVALTANPIGIIITLIGGLIIGFIAWYKHSEKLRNALAGIGAVLRVVGQLVIGFGETLAGALLFNPEMIKDGATRFGSAIAEIASKGIPGIYNEAANAHAVMENNQHLESSTGGGVDMSKFTGNIAEQTAGTGDKKTKLKGFESLSSGVKGVSEGGRSPKNITVNIKSLVEKFTIQTTNIKEGAAKVRGVIEEEFVRAVRDGEIAVGTDSL